MASGESFRYSIYLIIGIIYYIFLILTVVSTPKPYTVPYLMGPINVLMQFISLPEVCHNPIECLNKQCQYYNNTEVEWVAVTVQDRDRNKCMFEIGYPIWYVLPGLISFVLTSILHIISECHSKMYFLIKYRTVFTSLGWLVNMISVIGLVIFSDNNLLKYTLLPYTFTMNLLSLPIDVLLKET